MKKIILYSALLFNYVLIAQINCYIFPEDSGERRACELCKNASDYVQGSKEKQLLFDKAIAIGPKFAWAYYEKSVAYFKRGFLLEGIRILNKAIALDPKEYLPYRAYWYWQYKNYELCIEDLETYYAMPKAFMQMTPGGEKDMRIILGLAYAKTKNYSKGIEAMITCFETYDSEDDFGLSDYHSLGMLYVKNMAYDKAINTLKKQLTINSDLADTYYYLGLAYKGKNNLKEAQKWFNNALSKFRDPRRFYNINAGFKVYESDILKEINP